MKMRTPSAEPCVWMCGVRCRVPAIGVLLAALLGGLGGCGSTPQSGPGEPPPIEAEPRASMREVVGVIRRAEVPRNQPIDRAWALIDEQVLPPVTLGVWRGNGLRVGRMDRDQLDAFAKEMPTPIAHGTTTINQSSQPTPILESPTLPGSLRLEVDMTRPPYPREVERIAGGNNSKLRLLARIETRDDGRHQLVLTPHHYAPSPFDLLPRDPLEKELDGRVFDELTIRLPIGPDQIAVVGLYWPWPGAPQDDPSARGPRDGSANTDASDAQPESDPQPGNADRPDPPADTEPLPPAEPGDPAAPPPHLQSQETDEPPADPPDDPTNERPTARGQQDAPQQTAPPLTTTFGSRLFATTRVRIPVQTVLLITIEERGGP